MKICKNWEKKVIENEIEMIFNCNKYDNIRMKPFNDINKVDDINFQTENKKESNFFSTKVL